MASSMRGDPVDAPVTAEPTRSLLTTLAALRRILEGGVSVGTPELVETTVEADDTPEQPPTGRPPAWLRNGVRFDPDDCSSGSVYDPVCAPDGPPVDTIAGGETENVDVLTARIGVECSTAGDLDGALLRDRARRTMQVCQHGLMAAEFWRGDEARAGGHPNRFLSSGTAEILTADLSLPAVGALALIETALAGLSDPSCGCGERGLIHVDPATFAVLVRYGVVRFEGGLALSPSDHWIVTGPGYDGSGPSDSYEPLDAAGTDRWLYGTGLVDLRLGPARLTSDLDPDTNSRRVFVDRPFAFALGGCCHVAAQADLSAFLAEAV